jgi:hypothetical protein
MTHPLKFVSLVLAGALCVSGPGVVSADQAVSRTEMDQAVSKSLARESASRAAITRLLEREEVGTVASSYGIDLQRAQAAVGTLQGDELKRVSALAAQADSQLSGGAQHVTISLVAALLIVIIVILVAN